MIKFKRKINTGDKKDEPFKIDQESVWSFAYFSGDSFGEHTDYDYITFNLCS